MVEIATKTDLAGKIRQVSLPEAPNQFSEGQVNNLTLGLGPGKLQRLGQQRVIKVDVGSHGVYLMCITHHSRTPYKLQVARA